MEEAGKVTNNQEVKVNRSRTKDDSNIGVSRRGLQNDYN